MSKYINADALTEKTIVRLALIKEERKADYDNLETYNGMIRGLVEAQRYITETDTVEIVRCKDCEFWNTERPAGLKGYCYCEVYKGYKEAEGFCDCGEERESE